MSSASSTCHFIASVGLDRLLTQRENTLELGPCPSAKQQRLAPGNARWHISPCAADPNHVFISSEQEGSYLGTSGEHLHVFPPADPAHYGDRIQWYLLACPHQPGACYIFSARRRGFLDADGGRLSLWDTHCADVNAAIAGNTSQWAKNIRWWIGDAPATEAVPAPMQVESENGERRVVRIVHISDTHNMHRAIESKFPLPPGDILVHTGDFSNQGSPDELADFDAWLGEVGQRYRHVVVIPGNHDWYSTLNDIHTGRLDARAAVDRGFYQQKLRNCRVLCHEEVVLEGLRFFGSSWSPWQKDGSPDSLGDKGTRSSAYQLTLQAWEATGGRRHVFQQIPAGVDVLLTHGPADAILDCIGNPGRGWGSSRVLRTAIMEAKPRVHCFGHLHEQRGQWVKRDDGSGYQGGVEYLVHGNPFITRGPPPADYPCEMVSCNAMANHPDLDGTGVPYIAGPARLICLAPRSPM